MAIKGQSITVVYTAWDTANNEPKTGDVSNHTLRVVKDGTANAPTNSPAEVDATNCPGEYKLVLTADEMNASTVVVCGGSSTGDVSLIPVKIVTEQGELSAVKGAGWSSATDTLEKIRDAVANVPAQRQTQEI